MAYSYKKKEETTMKKGFSLAALLMMIVAVFAMFITDASAYDVKQAYARISVTAGETLSTGNVVAIKAADGKAYKADADDSTLRPAIGIAGKGSASGSKIEIVTSGIVTGWTSLTKGSPGYLSGTAGAVTQTSPAYSQQIATAISSTDYAFYFAPAHVSSVISCGTTATCSSTAISAAARILYGSVSLVAATPSAITITNISPAFTSTSSYMCTAVDTASATALVVNIASTSAITITSASNGITNKVNYICVGN